MSKLLLTLILLSSLTGCQIFKEKTPVINTIEMVKLDPEALLPCDQLRALKLPDGTEDPFLYTLDNHRINSAAYAKCAMKQNNSIILLKRFSNIKENK